MNFQPLKDFLDGYLSMLGIPGSDTSIYLDHKEIFRYSAGYDNILLKTPMRQDLIYNIYSCTKIATMVATAQLIERGEISLLDPVYAYIPEFRDVKVKVTDERGNVVGSRPATRPMLIKHLVSMTSGLNYNTKVDSIKDAVARTEGRAPAIEICRALAGELLEFDPGDKFNYSLSHDVMGGVIEVATGESLEEYMRKNIFAPLGMSETSFIPDYSKRHRFATHYSFDPKTGASIIPFENVGFRFGSEYYSGGGGLISTVDDYVLLMDALANGGVGKNGNRILASATVDLMRTNILTPEQTKSLWVNHSRAGYGYGWGVRMCVDKTYSGNLASLGEFEWDGKRLCFAMADPERRLAVFHAEHMGEYHDIVIPRLRNLIYSCIE